MALVPSCSLLGPEFRVGVGENAQVFVSFLTSSTPEPLTPHPSCAPPPLVIKHLLTPAPWAVWYQALWGYKREKGRPDSGAWELVRCAQASGVTQTYQTRFSM